MRRLLPAPATDASADLDDLGLWQEYRYPTDTCWLRANMVASVDGATTLNGRSGGLSNEADRRLFAILRARADVIIAGAGTVRAEGYGPAEHRADLVAWRRQAGQAEAAAIAVVSASLDLDPRAPLFRRAVTPTIVITAEAAPADRRAALARTARVLVAGGARVDLAQAVDALAAAGHRRLLCEGGPRLLGQLVAADLLDELCLTTSPSLACEPVRGLVEGDRHTTRPTPLELASLLEQDGYLFARYLRGRPITTTPYAGS